ncbi:MAG: MBL fold metallo-hydrolase [Cytophagales bacterium]|nr:MAG: MBL fold metallo-hydrolase [Cytophagales bacterium]
MKIEQIYTNCLAEAAYYIESEGEAVVIDPLREPTPYLERAKRDKAKIKYVLETHFHADFVSGHLDLAKLTGATIVYGPTATPHFKAHIAHDGELLKVGKLTIKVLHTPGHTLESSTFLLIDEKGNDYAIFTGDTLFIGDVGRPDLAVKSNITEKDLAGMLYESLHQKIMPLKDEVIVYPGHGAGSACGKNMSSETFDTLGRQKMFNYALKAQTKEAFVDEVLTGLNTPPQYFPKNAVLNKSGYTDFETLMKKAQNPLTADDFEDTITAENAIVIDVRDAQTFAKGFISNSLQVGLDGQFAPWIGTLVQDLQQPILLVIPEGKEEETMIRLMRVGYENIKGYLKGGIEAWQKAQKPIDTIHSIKPIKLV